MITAAFLIVWPIAAVLLGCLIGRSIHAADRPQHTSPYDDADHDLMALVQAENLSPADVDREIARMEAWL